MLYGLNKVDFNLLVQRLPALREAIAKEGAQRIQDTAAKIAAKPG